MQSRGYLKGIITGSVLGALLAAVFAPQRKLGHENSTQKKPEPANKKRVETGKPAENSKFGVKKLLRKKP